MWATIHVPGKGPQLFNLANKAKWTPGAQQMLEDVHKSSTTVKTTTTETRGSDQSTAHHHIKRGSSAAHGIKRRSSVVRRVRSRIELMKKQGHGGHKHFTRLHLWQKTWLNTKWRKRWRKKWGPNRWKKKLRDKWHQDREWRRKWMKRLRKHWWNAKWRRMWLKHWLEPKWYTRLEGERKKRKEFWMRKWQKSGCQRMGLTFHQFLLTEERLSLLKFRAQQTVRTQARRKDKRLNRELTIRQQQLKREAFNEERKKLFCFLSRWRHWLFETEHYGPETFGIRPAIVQLNLYKLNLFQGIVAFVIGMAFWISYLDSLRSDFFLVGLLVIVFFANMMDVFGSLFGMLTSCHLESYYGTKPPVVKKKKGFFRFFSSNKDDDDKVSDDLTINSSSMLGSGGSDAELDKKRLKSGAKIIKMWQGMLKEKSKSQVQVQVPQRGGWKKQRAERAERQKLKWKNLRSAYSSKVAPSDKSKTKRISFTGDTKGSGSMITSDQGEGKQKGSFGSEEDDQQGKCKCWGPFRAWCRFLRHCFKPGRSLEFINGMGYASWMLLQIAWFSNLCFPAYYTWVKYWSSDYNERMDKCGILPMEKSCFDFDYVYNCLLITVGVTFLLRSVLVFGIGLCFSERILKHCQPPDPNYEIPSSCSDSEVDYDRVPKQILIPYLLSKGRYPYHLPQHAKPKRKLKKEMKKTLRSKARKKAAERGDNREEAKAKRRLLSAKEKEAEKVMQRFREIRRAQVPLPKGRRKIMKLPVATGVSTKTQLPPELMTTKARAWLSEEDDSKSGADSSDENWHKQKAAQIAKRRRMRRKRDLRVKSNSLVHIKQHELPTVEEAIKEKIQRIHKRLSSDDSSWSSIDTVFEADVYREGATVMTRRSEDGIMKLYDDFGPGVEQKKAQNKANNAAEMGIVDVRKLRYQKTPLLEPRRKMAGAQEERKSGALTATEKRRTAELRRSLMEIRKSHASLTSATAVNAEKDKNKEKEKEKEKGESKPPMPEPSKQNIQPPSSSASASKTSIMPSAQASKTSIMPMPSQSKLSISKLLASVPDDDNESDKS